MFKFKNLTARNFMSIGNVTQSISFENDDLTLVLGENLDLGGEDGGAKNGVGKTTIVNALSYALYGVALTRIKKDNLINKTNGKHMVVSVEFEVNGQLYRIERGRRPAFLRFWTGETELIVDNEAQGDSRETQKAIEDILGMSHDMFKHIVALNTYTEPFLALNANNQRIIIEQLLGITLLSEKAENLRELNRALKREITTEETKIAATIDANKRIQEQINSLIRRSNIWEDTKNKDLEKLASALAELEEINIDEELEAHCKLQEYLEIENNISDLTDKISLSKRELSRLKKQASRLEKDIAVLEQKICHTCKQPFHGEEHDSIINEKKKLLADTNEEISELEELNADFVADLDELRKQLPEQKPVVFYDNLDKAKEHKSSITALLANIESKMAEQNPYTDQILEMEEQALVEIDYAELNEMSNLYEHQDFLLKLLTNKDSFIRKRIIEQNLAHLNARLSYYLEEMGLPHQVQFMNDLSVEITEFGRDLDFDNLSRGERNRLILSLSWAFRDVWEALYQPINLLFVDELVDSGLDAKGVDSALRVLKRMARDHGRSVWLVSHREELISRVNKTLKVIKENGYTLFSDEQ